MALFYALSRSKRALEDEAKQYKEVRYLAVHVQANLLVFSQNLWFRSPREDLPT